MPEFQFRYFESMNENFELKQLFELKQQLLSFLMPMYSLWENYMSELQDFDKHRATALNA